jgi:hypothetical protein
MLDKNKQEAFLKDLQSVWHLMEERLNPEQIAVVLDMDISTVNLLVDCLNETNTIVARSGGSMDFILDQYGLSLGIKPLKTNGL